MRKSGLFRTVAVAVLLTGVAISPRAWAVNINDACTAAQEGEWRQLDSPNGSVHVYCNGTNWLPFRTFSNGDLNFTLGGSTVLSIKDSGMINIQGKTGYPTPPTDWTLDSANSTVYNLTDQIGIGTATPDAGLLLDVEVKIGATEICLQDGTGCVDISTLGTPPSGPWTVIDTDRIYFDSAGTTQVGIGTNNPSETFEVVGNIKTSRIGVNTDPSTYDLEVNGQAAKTDGGTWSVVSDRRLKDIHGDYGKGLADIMKLHAVRFSYKKDNPAGLESDKEFVGFIAQEVQPVFPEAISTRSDGYLDFNIHAINVALVNAIQELKKEKDAQIKALKEEKDAQIKALSDRLDALEKDRDAREKH